MDRRFPTLTCGGLRAGQSLIPPFDVGPGEMVKIVFPEQRAPDMHLAERLICQELNRSQLTLTVELAQQPSWWRELLRPQTAVEWLVANCGIPRTDAEKKLSSVEISPDLQVNCLAGNPRWLLGFLSALHRSPAALVFTTSGCDPLGIQDALAAVSSQLTDAAGIYLSCFRDLKINEPPYAAVLAAQACESTVEGAYTAMAN